MIKILSAKYDDGDHTVTLHPARLLPLSSRSRLTVRGTGVKGLADNTDTLLDGKATGQPGSDYVAIVKRSNFVFTTYAAKKQNASKALHASQVTHVSAHAVDHVLGKRAATRAQSTRGHRPRG